MINPLRVPTAAKIIYNAERELGPLTDGQRRDLLKDNTTWSSPDCDELVAHLAFTVTWDAALADANWN